MLSLPGMSIEDTFHKHSNNIARKCVQVGEQNLRQAARQVHYAYRKAKPELADKDVIDIAVSYDGTWQKRSFSSHNGVGVVIDLLTGLVLDTEVLSNYCSPCSKAASRFAADEQKLTEWQQNHKEHCDRNHEGSAGSMEAQAAIAMG